ncbi:uncharacterized protein LOC123205207 isoform X1 [Mangifera indica]|uniref:uncharacterized protein LOC123205207 isoform X1 n=1 Tax=Mangifera indica TaxID=29780 RepID=UPI001CF99AB0|nr:uncharacterized protein LOC123205207 isoform X1 [Mangifera indica]
MAMTPFLEITFGSLLRYSAFWFQFIVNFKRAIMTTCVVSLLYCNPIKITDSHLLNCQKSSADTMVGDEMRSGLSGGQQRRVQERWLVLQNIK